MITFRIYTVLVLAQMKIRMFWSTEGAFIVELEDRHHNVLDTKADEGANNERTSGKGISVTSHHLSQVQIYSLLCLY